MIEYRPFNTLGTADYGWLQPHYHFSFSQYFDRNRMQWGNLRVWNDDTIAPQSGFPTHPHKEMEIITYVRSGAISHEDSLGNRGRTAAGDVPVMSVGAGIYHSEYNLENETTTLFQIWIMPTQESAKGEPFWGIKEFPKGERSGQFITLASGFDSDLANGALPIRTDARVVGATIKAGDRVEYHFEHAKRYGYLAAFEGSVEINGLRFEKGDGAAIHGETMITVSAVTDAELVLVETE